jgi:hypothetical protein
MLLLLLLLLLLLHWHGWMGHVLLLGWLGPEGPRSHLASSCRSFRHTLLKKY